jgi:hypothetical protein
MTLAHLLAPAVRVQYDALHHPGILEIRDGRIVGGDVPILADPYKSEIDRPSCPGSLARTHPNATGYLDTHSSALLWGRTPGCRTRLPFSD